MSKKGQRDPGVRELDDKLTKDEIKQIKIQKKKKKKWVAKRKKQKEKSVDPDPRDILPMDPLPCTVTAEGMPHKDTYSFREIILNAEEESGIPCHILEKDYWLTLSLWALRKCGIYAEFRGGSSLAKGFGTIQRTSEDVDICVYQLEGIAKEVLKEACSKKNQSVYLNKLWHTKLERVVKNNIPDTSVRLGGPADPFYDPTFYNGTFWVTYEPIFPDKYGGVEPNSVFPHIIIEVGSAATGLPLIHPQPRSQIILKREIRCILQQYSQMVEQQWPTVIMRCVHPCVTVIQKIYDCIIYRYCREVKGNALSCPAEKKKGVMKAYFDPRNVRHFEDCAETIIHLNENTIYPPLKGKPKNINISAWPYTTPQDITMNPAPLVDYFFENRIFKLKKKPDCSQLAALIYPGPNSESEHIHKWELYEEAFQLREGFHWGDRLTLKTCAETIRHWLKSVE